MATLPDFTALGGRAAPQPAGGIATYTPTAGADIERAGAATMGAAEIIAETNQRQNVMVAQAKSNALQSAKIDLENEFKNIRGEGAVGQTFLDTYQQKFSDKSKEIEVSLENDAQRRVYQQRAEIAGLQFKSSLYAHQSTETNSFNDKTENDTVDLGRRGIFTNPADPNALEAGTAQIAWAIKQKGQRLGWSQATVDETTARYMQSVYDDTVSLMVERDPRGTLALLNKRIGADGQPADKTGVLPVDAIDIPKLVTLHRHAQAKVDQEDNALRRDVDARNAVALRTVNSAVDLADKGQYFSPEFTAQLKRDTAGTVYEAQTQTLLAEQDRTAGFASAPAAARTAALEAARAQSVTPGKGVDPTASKDLARWERIDTSINAAYKDNPWQAAQQYGAIQRAPVVNIAKPDDVLNVITARNQAISNVEAHAGKPISPLQPQEAEQFGRLLKTLPPDQSSALLSQIGTVAGSAERIALIAKQLGTNNEVHELMMLSAGDKTNAGRTTAELISRGALALADKTVKRDDAVLTGWKAEIATLVNGTLGNPQAEEQIKKSAYLVRAAMDDPSAKAPGFGKVGDSDAASSIAMVVGWPIERQGVKTLLPRGMKEGAFDDALSKFKAPDLAAMSPTGKLYVGGQELSPQRLANELTSVALRRSGSGAYIPMRNGRMVTVDPAGTVPLAIKVQ